HWESIDRLAQRFPDVTVDRDAVWVDEGAVVTSAGISAGIDMSLHLVERVCGRSVALATAPPMEYTWREQAGGRPSRFLVIPASIRRSHPRILLRCGARRALHAGRGGLALHTCWLAEHRTSSMGWRREQATRCV